MRSPKLTHRNVTVICCLWSLAILPPAMRSGVKTPLAPSMMTYATLPDLSRESKVIESYVDDLDKFNKQCAQLNHKTTLTETELNQIESAAGKLNVRSAEIQDAARRIITKLKDANQWNGVDAQLVSLSNGESQSRFRKFSFRTLLEETAADASSQNETNAYITTIRAKLNNSSTDASSAGAPTVRSFSCRVHRLASALNAIRNGGKVDTYHGIAEDCACGNSIGHDCETFAH